MKFLFLISLYVIFVFSGNSQVLYFSGGSGRGDSNLKSVFLLLNGSISETRFLGGSGAGSSIASLNISLLNGDPYKLLYSGGLGDGNTISGLNPSFLTGNLLNSNFSGSSGRGDFISTSSVISLNGIGIGIGQAGFTGGNGSGSYMSSNNGQFLLNGNTQNVTFSGGNGSGNALFAANSLFLSGVIPQVLFSGGNGMGYSNSLNSSFLYFNGLAYVLKFSGGLARGDFMMKSNSLLLNGVASGSGLRVAFSQITKFEVNSKNGNLILSWNANNRQTISRFEIERSENGHLFSRVGSVKILSLEEKSDYRFVQKGSQNEIEYFRIRILNIDSSFTHSDVIQIENQSLDQKIALFPNPATDKLTIQFSTDSEISLKEPSVFCISGKRIPSSFKVEGNRLVINTSEMMIGLYFIEIQTERGLERFRFVKE